MAKSILITGASTGIGRACVKRLNSEFQVFAGVRKEEDAKALRKISQTIIPLQLDVTQDEQVKAAVSQIQDVVGDKGLYALVNNEGIALAAPLEFLAVEDLRRLLDVNLLGLLAVTQAMMPLLRLTQGRIVNIGSIAGRVAAPLSGAYTISKFALEGLSDCLRLELKSSGIHVAIVDPGPTDSSAWSRSVQRSEQLNKTLSQEAFQNYGGLINRTKQRLKEAPMVAEDAVAEQVAHALTARRPRVRYLTGSQARRDALLARWLPAVLLDRIILSR